MESKKLLTAYSEEDGLWNPGGVPWDEAVDHDTCIAHELLDPTRKTPETPLEHEQREVIRQLAESMRRVLNPQNFLKIHTNETIRERDQSILEALNTLAAAAPHIQD